MSHMYRPLRFNEFKKFPETIYPWYKERLQVKYLKKNSTNCPKFLIPRDWMKITDCSNDCRDGYPPPMNPSGGIVKGEGSIGPNVFGENNDANIKSLNQLQKRFTAEDIAYSKVMPLKKQRQYNIEEIELGLIQHPLALYPHLESAVPADVFEEVVDIIDPDMNMTAEDVNDQLNLKFTPTSTPHIKPGTSATENASINTQIRDDSSKEPINNYRWISKKEEKDRKNMQNENRLEIMAENDHIKSVTNEFCNWVTGLGGESNNIEEPTVTSLFASGYETKPALSVPIHVIELTSIPPELRGNVAMPPKRNELDYRKDVKSAKIIQTNDGNFEKFRYGAWYLKSNLWRKMKINESLEDPKLMFNQKYEDHKARVLALNTELANMQGSQLFDDFIEKTKKRKPKFLNEVAEVRVQIEKDKEQGNNKIEA